MEAIVHQKTYFVKDTNVFIGENMVYLGHEYYRSYNSN